MSLEFLLGELDDTVSQIDTLSFAIVNESKKRIVTDYLLRGVVEVASEQGRILQQLEEEYGFENIVDAQCAYRQLQDEKRQRIYEFAESLQRHSVNIKNQDGVPTQISFNGEISVDVVDLNNGYFALLNRFYALESHEEGSEGELEYLGIYFSEKAAYEALEALKSGAKIVPGKSIPAVEYIEATGDMFNIAGKDWQGTTALEFLNTKIEIEGFSPQAPNPARLDGE